ncbi:MAG TPA: hypothetical protein VNC18_23365 [Gemmatimonadaceae bacterium]|jgi:hypothetical protein|nr:hypothetical protein [Gemmatimonadaceae bacterium]
MIRAAVLGVLCIVVPGAAAVGQQTARPGQKPTPCELVPQPTTRLTVDTLPIPGGGQVAFVGGGVLIKCPARGMTLKGDSAERYPDHDQMIGHASYDEPRLHVDADFLNYFPNEDIIRGAGNVHATLPSGSRLDGPQAEYRRPSVKLNRPHRQLSAIARPTITIIEKDSAGKPVPPTTVIANQVFMDGDSLIYGGGEVEINRPDISTKSDSAFIDQEHETMKLMRNPKMTGKKDRPFTLAGDLITLYSKNHKLQRVLSQAKAVATSDSLTLRSDTIDLRVVNDLLDHAYVWGRTSRARALSPSQDLIADSLDVWMPGQRVQLVRALPHAFAQGRPDTTRFKVERPDTTDWLVGDTIVATFDSLRSPRDTSRNPNIKQLIASGNASSLYHVAPSDSGERRFGLNYVTARLITVDFTQQLTQQKVATVTTVDSVYGVYVEPRSDSGRTRAVGQKPAQNGAPKTQPKPVPKPPLPAKPPDSTPFLSPPRRQ